METEKEYKELNYKEKLKLNFSEYSMLYKFYEWLGLKKGEKRKK